MGYLPIERRTLKAADTPRPLSQMIVRIHSRHRPTTHALVPAPVTPLC